MPAFPLADRDSSKLLIYENGKISEDRYRGLAAHLPEGSLMVFNNTRVVPARMLFRKESGGVIEIFCLEPDDRYPDITSAMAETNQVFWKCLVGGASKWKHGQVLKKELPANGTELRLEAHYVEKKPDHFIIHFEWKPGKHSFAEVLQLLGAIPLPPYIKREAEAGDAERYQTIYSAPEGSVAAPTAGLHFTERIFDSLREKNIHSEFLTLHVGAGTFKPVKSERMEGHAMHAEWIDVSRSSIAEILEHLEGHIVAVGTTSLRTLESLYWFGRKLILTGSISPIEQWEPYESSTETITAREALQALLDWMDAQQMKRFISRTGILIAPGYTLKITNSLITNFHQPGSTLLLLVAAVIGEDWKKVYKYALENDFRFLSYGDGCLLKS